MGVKEAMPISADMPMTPTTVALEYEGGEHVFRRISGRLALRDMQIELQMSRPEEPWRLEVSVTAEATAVLGVRLRWDCAVNPTAIFLGDAWSGTAGECQWRAMEPYRRFPWYFLCRTSEETQAVGVQTCGGAFAEWQVDPAGISLRLDLCCGERGVVLNGRRLVAAVILNRRYELAALAAARAFCAELSPEPIMPPLPVYGAGDGAYSRGQSSAESILRDADLLARLADGLTNRPFQIVDCGWQAASDYPVQPCGPWDQGNERFPDMAALASGMHNRGIRPGIALRLLCDANRALPEEWHLQRDPHFLDPSLPGVLEHIQADVRRMADWGYELIRHRNSLTDMLGEGWQPGTKRGGWAFADRGRTTAEITTDFYRAVHAAAGDALIYGDDVVGHLGAGLMHLARIAKESPGLPWLRQQHDRVNALAFRLAQHGAFFAVDTGEIPITAALPWKQVRKWTDLAASSGTACFISMSPEAETPAAIKELKRAFEDASLGYSQVVAGDWIKNTCPERWEINGVQREYHWFAR